MNKLGIGVIGLKMGAHLLHVNRHPGRFQCEVRGLCDVLEERRTQYSADFHVPFGTADWRELVRRQDIDIVGIFSPDHLHFEMLRESLEAGKHVICTKPMVVSLEEAKETVRLVRKHGRKFLVGQTRRFVKFHQEVKALYDSGKLGRAMMAEASYVHGDMWTVFDRGSWRYEHPQDLLYGGASHPVDHLRWYFGDVEEVHALGCPSPVDPRYPQNKALNISIHLRFKNGVLGRVFNACGIHAPPGGHSGDIMPCEGVSIFGTHGTIVNYHAAFREGGRHDAPREEVHFERDDAKEEFDGCEYGGHLISVLKFVSEMEQCILEDRTPTVNEIEGAKGIATCAAAAESLRTGGVVKVCNEF